MGIFISSSGTLQVNATIGSNIITVTSGSTARLVIGMSLSLVSGTNFILTGTTLRAISGSTLTLSRPASVSATASFVFFTTTRIDNRTVGSPFATVTANGTDMTYSRGIRKDVTYSYSNSYGYFWFPYSPPLMVSGKTYRIMSYTDASISLSTYGTVTNLDGGVSSLLVSNGTQWNTTSIQNYGGSVQYFETFPTNSNLNNIYTRIPADNDIIYVDIRESLLPIYVAGQTSSAYRLKLIEPNSIVIPTIRYSIISGSSSVVFSTALAAIRKNSSIEANQDCFIAMSAAGGGGAGGRDGSFQGAGGGGSGGWFLFRTIISEQWPSVTVPAGGVGRPVNSTLAGGNGGGFNITLSNGAGNITINGGNGGTWSGTSGIGGTAGTTSVTAGNPYIAATLHRLSGANGGNGNANNSRGFNSTTQTGVALSVSTTRLLGGDMHRKTNTDLYNLYNASNAFLSAGPRTAKNGGTSPGGLGGGGGGGGSAYAAGGLTNDTAAVAGNYGSGGGGGRSNLLSGSRRAGANGGAGVFMIFA
jgi:hypothetical protein